MEARKPPRQEVVPPRDHWEARASGEVDAHHRNRAQRHKHDRYRRDGSGDLKRVQSEPQRLRNWPDQIDLIIADEGEHRTRAENEHGRDDWRCDENAATDVARRRAAFAGENTD